LTLPNQALMQARKLEANMPYNVAPAKFTSSYRPALI
jgi:hypothetical protein